MWGRNLLSKAFDILCRSYSNRGVYTAVHRPHPVACGQHSNKESPTQNHKFTKNCKFYVCNLV